MRTAASKYGTRALTYIPSAGGFFVMDSTVIEPGNAPMRITRGWIAPEGPHGSCIIREVWFHAVHNAAHGVTIRVVFDYDEAKYVERSWSAAELAPLLEDGRYTVSVNAHGTNARAVKVTVTETESAGDAMRPLSLVVSYGANAGNRRRTLKAGALK